ncbi:MAG: DUF1559 domain-containing protein [Verrucomicrobiae bacterium]|nr:DUF1559 domain-containing protein [Verrucomicrobiae bacterium]
MKRRLYFIAGFSLSELLVSIGLVFLLFSILMPVLKSVRETSRKIQCMNNLKQIGAALHQYANDNDDWIVPYIGISGDKTTYWNFLLEPYLGKNQEIFHCPASRLQWPPPSWYWNACYYVEYGYNRFGLSNTLMSGTYWKKFSNISDHASKMVVSDRDEDSTGSSFSPYITKTGSYHIEFRHHNGALVLFLDGHTSFCVPNDIQDVWWGW